MNEFFSSYEKLKSSPLFICGESYAGHYIPAFAAGLLKD
jgi:carboxypeptidase C (cathepsin A)